MLFLGFIFQKQISQQRQIDEVNVAENIKAIADAYLGRRVREARRKSESWKQPFSTKKTSEVNDNNFITLID
jgi:hypothetical protein